ncbi:MAG: CDP-alcohol phosphatidyltransferase family protein [Anaerotignum sp.]|nr:CDP-alcohol phosphatidyltransferase family protein [Anaerotignum sp.]
MKMKKQAANFITICRIFGSILLLYFSVFSSAFYILYLFCGFTDMVDGTIARKTNAESAFGARLDTVADFVFVTVSLIKFLPVLDIPKWLWVWIAVIAAIRVRNMMFGWIFSGEYIALHTILNKLTGFLLFLLPLSLHFIELKYSAVVVCAAATVSAVQEGWLMKKGEME